MSEEELALSRQPGGIHHELASLAGEWGGMTQTWFEPGKLGDTQPITATLQPILEDRFLVYEYQSTLMGSRRDGLAVIGYNLLLKRYEIAWIDTAHNATAIMFSAGAPGATAISADGAYPAPEGPSWGWRTTLARPAPDQLTITMYNIPPGGEPYKGVETRLVRVG